MKLTDFNETIQKGDTVIILANHSTLVPKDDHRYTFLGFDYKCKLCPDCPGYVKLIRLSDNKINVSIISDCYRSEVNNSIRLKIVHQNQLPNELFEI